jgi:hypothetical protein
VHTRLPCLIVSFTPPSEVIRLTRYHRNSATENMKELATEAMRTGVVVAAHHTDSKRAIDIHLYQRKRQYSRGWKKMSCKEITNTNTTFVSSNSH